MPSLLDPLSADARRLLQVIAEGFGANDDAWPVWQYAALRLEADGPDPDDTLRNLPTWQHYYRPVSVPGHGVLPEPDHQIALTVHGLFHVRHPATGHLLRAFLAALGLAAEHQLRVIPLPDRMQEITIQGLDFTQEVNKRADVSLTPRQLASLLRREPATWSGIQNDQSDDWTWNLTRLRLSHVREVTTAEGYLTALEQIVGIPVIAATEQLPPLALPEALDHLDLMWRVVTGQRLLRVPRATSAGLLTQPAASGGEFAARCSALADVLSSFKLAGLPDTGSLQRLETQLQERLGDTAGRAVDGVGTLRHLIALRAGQQHGGAANRSAKAQVSLGLVHYGSDWTGAWDRVRAVAVDALTTIREEIATLIPD
ncbi:hypothetical protein [Frankia sp. CiP3]|uniref:hypothetical protein n=1 Tax=Frankia sp. CiP3 TaxID=2880971 RepID=UPI001EF50127|nr:hypothetical protein [Frankia sp. CiP3]